MTEAQRPDVGVRARRTIKRAITILLATAAIWVAWISLSVALFEVETHGGPPGAAEWPGSHSVAHWDRFVARGFVRGAADTEYHVVVFGDYQCAPCAEIQHRLRLLLDEYPTLLSIRFRHFPVAKLHPYAFDAARAAECAGTQGSFGRLHDLLFEGQERIGSVSWAAFAKAAGVPDSGAFSECMSLRLTARAVELDVEVGRAAGVRATPAMVVNGHLFRSLGSALQQLQLRLGATRASAPAS